jgi:hypothetical protein
MCQPMQETRQKRNRTRRSAAHVAQNGTAPRARASARCDSALTLGSRQTRTVKAQARFLREFAVTGNVLRSALAAMVGRRTVYHWLKDEKFSALYQEAHEDALDVIEEEARRRAVDGVLEPIVSAGKVVAHVRRYSDSLLALLLRGKRPNTFRDRFEHTGKDGRALFRAHDSMTDDEVEAEWHRRFDPPATEKASGPGAA